MWTLVICTCTFAWLRGGPLATGSVAGRRAGERAAGAGAGVVRVAAAAGHGVGVRQHAGVPRRRHGQARHLPPARAPPLRHAGRGRVRPRGHAVRRRQAEGTTIPYLLSCSIISARTALLVSPVTVTCQHNVKYILLFLMFVGKVNKLFIFMSLLWVPLL